MKNAKLGFIVLLLIFSSAFYGFKSYRKNNPELKLYVTSEAPASFSLRVFDKTYEKGVKDLKNLKTPYELSVNTEDVKILGKKEMGAGSIKFHLKDLKNEPTGVMGSWPVTVILIKNGNMETFGIE